MVEAQPLAGTPPAVNQFALQATGRAGSPSHLVQAARTRGAVLPTRLKRGSFQVVKLLLVVNTLLTLPFGVAALAAPVEVFAQFGVALDPGGALVARGYAATLVGYGLALWLLRNRTEAAIARPLLLSAVAFNAIESVIQGIAGAQGIALPIIFGNAGLHALVAGVCAFAYVGLTDA